ncbi:hypothetical protein PIB30_075917 [Stylosanthes scabra]|uniref:Uncharacterized protein n=1 Tax=Stylosanthes scabra TaxID=79078 RepID=A0ABU6ZPE1_9FABA|nr:hypothetical protein [Stylosanthes scabra]
MADNYYFTTNPKKISEGMNLADPKPSQQYPKPNNNGDVKEKNKAVTMKDFRYDNNMDHPYGQIKTDDSRNRFKAEERTLEESPTTPSKIRWFLSFQRLQRIEATMLAFRLQEEGRRFSSSTSRIHHDQNSVELPKTLIAWKSD